MFKYISITRVQPGKFGYRCLYTAGKLYRKYISKGYGLGVSIYTDDTFQIVLMPLSGSSAIQKEFPSKISKYLDNSKKTYVLNRQYSKRMTSFYNKKVRNPDEIGKAFLLGTCAPLNYDSTEKDFLNYIEFTAALIDKDKHLLTTEQIIAKLCIADCDLLDIEKVEDFALLQNLLKNKLSVRVNSSNAKARFQGTVKFDLETEMRIDAVDR